MFGHSSNDPLDRLLSRLVDGLLSKAEQAELERILRSDPAARERYRLHIAAHVELATQPREVLRRATTTPWRKAALPLAAAASVALVLLPMLWNGRKTPVDAPPGGADGVADNRPVLGVISLAEDTGTDRDEPLARGRKLRAGSFRVTAGTLVLDLIGGERLTLRGPAEIDLVNERELFVRSGSVALRANREESAYIIRVPGGAAVNFGAEISVKVDPEGHSLVRVFEGNATTSVVDSGGRTRQERRLTKGDTVRIASTLENVVVTDSAFVRSHSGSQTDRSPAGHAYASAVGNSQPLAWWRFDRMQDPVLVAPEAGEMPLMLQGSPRIAGDPGSRFLMTDSSGASGFATTPAAIPGLDSANGFSVELLLHPLAEAYGTALALDQPDLVPPPGENLGRYTRHAPQRMLIERTGLRGSLLGHVHPDFALRAMMRSPAGYQGGINTYSSESHLLHRWIHVAFTHDGRQLRLYVDGRLSDEAPGDLPFLNSPLRPIIGRMQPLRIGEKRQWHGGIDEVAFYGRVLAAAEISSHADALDR